ncbi:MAG TPA: D-glycero-beta-D-manno-heptose-7-phosphate kinase [Acidobacteriota bacterium]|nr:D-glycero-beta-D-manno-heptose-7-phosphate kinase [Acidobacteriota bacterium]
MPLKPHRVDEITAGIGRSRVLILGDVMLDEYLYGKVGRISPEAPVPVVEVDSTRLLLGGAANVAANIRALGDRPALIGVVGDDDASGKLTALFREKGIDDSLLVTDPSRPTTIKTRIIAHSQQVVRADREKRHGLGPTVEQQVMQAFLSAVDECSAVIVSDYGKGVITLPLLEKVIDVCLTRDVFLAVDPKETRFHDYRKVSLITPNHHEAGFAYGRRINSMEDLIAVGQGLLEKLEAKAILITRGREGMSLFRVGHEATHIRTFARHVYDVTGAGDTVIATFVSAVCAGADLVEAAIVANAGAGCTVAEVGTATVTADQLMKELNRNIRNGNVASAGSDSGHVL